MHGPLLLMAALAAFDNNVLPARDVRAIPADAPKVRARVNGAPITAAELDFACGFHERTPEERRRVERRELDKLIERELLWQDAQRRLADEPGAWTVLRWSGQAEADRKMRDFRERFARLGIPCDTDKQFQQVLKDQRIDVPQLRRHCERTFVAIEHVRQRVGPLPPAELAAEYEKIVTALRQQARIEILD